MDGKKILILSLGILAGLYLIQETKVGEMVAKIAPPKPDFQPIGDDGATAVTLAIVATGVGILANKYL